ncbi:non-ribosomal peptide synthetase [Marinitenerispora sediminis]
MRMVLTFHHLLLDGWSLPLLLDDVLTAYAGGEPRPRRPFRDHVAWIRRQDTATGLRYWRTVLAGFDAPVPLPYDRDPEDVRAARSTERLACDLSPEDSAAVHAFARRNRLTVNALVQGAWALLLSVHSGRTDVVFGATTSGRPADLPGADTAIGLFINTLPVRVRVDPAAPAAAWLRGIQDRQVESRGYDFLPLARVQAESALPGDTPLFDSIVVFENYPVDRAAAERCGVAVAEVTANEATNYPLTLSAYATGRVRLLLGYEPRHFDAGTVRRLLDDLARIVRTLVRHPDTPIGRLPVRAGGDTAPRTDGATAPLPERAIHELFAECAAARPDADAVVGAGGRLSYAELDARAERLARRLREAGVRPESRVALLLPRSPRAVVAMLAVLKAGAGYLPVHDEVPPERVAWLLADGAVAAVVADADARHRLPAEPAVPVVDPGDASPEDPRPAGRGGAGTGGSGLGTVPPGAAAYVMYTSGSTGVPKGVTVGHRNVVALARDRRWRRGHERVLFHSPHAFDAATYEVWVPLLSGGTVVVAETADLTPEALRGYVEGHGVTALFLTAALFAQLAHQAPECFTGLAEVWAGGEAVPPGAVARVREACPDVEVVNGYGPTETTTFAVCGPITLADARAGTAPIGRPMDNTRALVLDPLLRPVPMGVPGELYIGGPGVARGYEGRRGPTAERFVADPSGSGTRLYRTGDLVRWTADHRIEYLGRTDGQVKVRGFRIELGEVENALAGCAGVAQAVAAVAEAPSGARRLVGYLVPEAGAGLDPAAVAARVAAVLPGYMVPAPLTLIDAVPLTPNGKVDRRALPDPDWAAGTSEGHAPPETVAERAVADIWAAVLGLERVGADDNFFEIGGDSVVALRIVGEVEAAFAVRLPTRTVFDHQSVRGFAAAVEAAVLADMAE